ncbi:MULTISPECIES: MgtC/SapB family protein [Pseudoxanthomonas]|jgi:putative Mg2+ transporter-C (MgtC) family protein|uniref:Protein MgtC n=1 Tax=Pseudoxanthomonas winnipegensis TaxID=2480810 RepID=A0A4Q8L4W0_9GAMM|nr:MULTISPECIES: MgtC/SapB family protein [Pseudoxanthomonas]TAA21287.1 MgtC/SapB family protein [Pseudoxanthomonas winnipegensis]TMN18947.1 MgtC/SapB family protein [Pseudoxanthomonas sp. X-1]UAY74520.1 MgtC/SapB family protein [Pseudoxanthomonas sp. X-1]
MLDTWEIALRLLLAALLGGIIGADRGRLEWAAGLRTHMLVCVGAALAIIVSAFGFSEALTQPHVVLDPSRIAAQVISGVGFLGAGTILFLQREQVIRGLTTAAGLWAVASIGLAVGSGLYAAAVLATALLWIILALLKPLERRYLRRRRASMPGLKLVLSRHAPLGQIQQQLERSGLPVQRMILKPRTPQTDLLDVRCEASVPQAALLQALEDLRGVAGVEQVDLRGSVGR